MLPYILIQFIVIILLILFAFIFTIILFREMLIGYGILALLIVGLLAGKHENKETSC
jgi:hypothetical protein